MQVQIKNVWDDVVSKCYEELTDTSNKSTPFQSFSFVKSMYDNNTDSEPVFLLVKNGSKFIAIAALEIRTLKTAIGKVKVLRFINNNISDYNGISYHSETKPSQIVKYIYKSFSSLDFDLFDFDNLMTDDYVNRELLTQLGFHYKFSFLVKKSDCPMLLLNRFEKDVLKKVKKDTERCLKRLNENHKVKVVIGEKITSADMDLIVDMKTLVYGKHELCDYTNKKIILDAIENGIDYDFSYLVCDDEIIAYHFGFVDSNTFYYYVPTFKREYSKYSIGNILLLELIKYYHNLGYDKFDFLRGAEEYKRSWTSYTSWNNELIAASSKKGMAYAAYLYSRRCIAKLKARWCI
ncbi:GNAT family N-acetyltransferase [Vibrio gigantis]|uniref:GNAT family N-acetyltransferase n=1 Tax=Vibrio gigantis TaxID=296199 RepID=UPI002FC93634